MTPSEEPHTQPLSSTWTVAEVKRKAIRGAIALGLRQALVQGANLLGGIALARLLTPAEFGLYGIVTFILSFLITFGDVGLGAALIREEREPTAHDYGSVFCVQQLLIGFIVVIMYLAAPSVARAYHLRPEDAWIFRLVALSLFFTSFQVIPSIRLERSLAFDRLAMAEVAEAIVYNGVAVVLARRGMGAVSFAIALCARSIVGAVLVNVLSPWKLDWRWDWAHVRSHLAFGLPYQGISFVSLVKDSITPVLVGLFVGAADVGYINWAQMIAAYPVMGLMIFQRIYLPTFARLQSARHELSRFVEQVVWATNAITAPLAVLTWILFPFITTIVFGEKWMAAQTLFRIFCFGNLFVPTSTPLLGLLNALGASKKAFFYAVVWMASTWLFGVPLILRYGALGFAIANAMVMLTNVALFRTAQALIPFRIFRPIAPVWAAAAATGGATAGALHFFTPRNTWTLAATLVASVLVFAGILYIIDFRRATSTLHTLGNRA